MTATRIPNLYSEPILPAMSGMVVDGIRYLRDGHTVYAYTPEQIYCRAVGSPLWGPMISHQSVNLAEAAAVHARFAA